ncbi:hypothetical protein THAOC_26332, partial [Thalassiosira oceanica]
MAPCFSSRALLPTPSKPDGLQHKLCETLACFFVGTGSNPASSKCPIGLESGSIESPWPGDHGNGLPNGQGRPAKRVLIENSALASVRKCPSSAKRDPTGPDPDHPRIVSCGRTRRGPRNRLKSSFLESSRRSLQAALNRRIQGRRGWELGRLERHAACWRAAAMSKDRRSSPGGLAKKKTRGMMAAASRKTLGVLRRVLKRTLGVLRRRQGRAETTPEGERVVRGPR